MKYSSEQTAVRGAPHLSSEGICKSQGACPFTALINCLER